MTVISAIVKDGKIYMGGDRSGNRGGAITTSNHPKIFYNSGYLIGFSHSFRMGDILRYVFKPPVIEDDFGMEFMISKFIPILIKTFKDNNFSTSQNGVDVGGDFLVAARGKLFEVQNNFSVLENMNGMHTLGSGRDEAMSSLLTSVDYEKDQEKRILKSMECAEELVSSVRRPFDILTI